MSERNIYLIRRLEESSNYFSRSFSYRYCQWKRYYSIRKAVYYELKRLNTKEPIKILDVGCADGWLLYQLKAEFSQKYKLEFFGIDISSLDIDFANQRKEYFAHQDCYFLFMDARELGFGSQEFDIVISSELIEHIPEPQEVLKQIYRVLKKSGLSILTTPHKGSGIFARFLRLIKRKNNAKEEKHICNFIADNEIPKIRLSSEQGITGAGYGHISVKSENEWQVIFKNIGFRLVSVEGTSGLLFGSPYLDKYRILFVLTVILDVLLEKFPFSYIWAETLFFELRKC